MKRGLPCHLVVGEGTVPTDVRSVLRERRQGVEVALEKPHASKRWQAILS